MKKQLILVGIIFLFTAGGFSGCITESSVPAIANEMEEKYDSIYDYRANVNYTTRGEYTKEYINTIKKPDKLRYEYLTPEYRNGDLNIINGDTQWRYDKSKNKAYEDRYSENIGEEYLDTPDFLNMLLFLVKNMNLEILDDESVDGRIATVIEVTPKTQTTFSKWNLWLDKDTLFPIKWEVYDTFGNLSYMEIITSFETNINISDSEFELPEGAEIITPADLENPLTIEECENIVGFSILFPIYLPESYSLDEEYTIGSGGTSLSAGGTFTIGYFQNNIKRQVYDTIETVRITYPHVDSYAEIINSTTGEVLAIVNTTTGNFPSEWYGNIHFETYTYDITLYEALENVFEEHHQPKQNATFVDINGIEGEYYIDIDTNQIGEIVYRRACLSWNLNEYWFFLTAGGDAFLEPEEMVLIAESIET